jgi:hypothetical protein
MTLYYSLVFGLLDFEMVVFHVADHPHALHLEANPPDFHLRVLRFSFGKRFSEGNCIRDPSAFLFRNEITIRRRSERRGMERRNIHSKKEEHKETGHRQPNKHTNKLTDPTILYSRFFFRFVCSSISLSFLPFFFPHLFHLFVFCALSSWVLLKISIKTHYSVSYVGFLDWSS